MLLGSYLSERKQGRKSHGQRLAEYREHKARIERDAAEALEAERIARRDECPDPATVLSIASGPRRRLWERRRSNPDYLLLRVGTADLPSAVELTDPEQDEHRRQVFWQIPDAPVAVPLSQRRVLGVAGPGDTSRAVGRWLVAQLATLHSPNDLQICLLTDSSGRMSWEWVRWLPHCRPSGGRGGAALVGNDAESVATRIAELLALIAERQKALRQGGQQEGQFQPDLVVVFDGSRKLRSLPGSIQLLREGPAVGVYAVCLDADERLLPAECQAVVVVDPDGLRVQQMMAATVRQVRPDGVNPGWCTRLARAIAPIRDASDDDDAAGLPDSARLLDVLRLEPPTGRGDRGPVECRRPVHAGDDRRVLRRAVRDRHQEGRPARADRGHDRGGQVRAAAVAGRLARGRQPARRDDVRAGRLQGRQRVLRLRAPPAHGRHGHRPGPAPGRAGPGVPVGRADQARAHSGGGRRQGHRGLPDPARPEAGQRAHDRRSRCPGC